MEDVILNDIEPSLDTMRRLGYRERPRQLEQDEDPILGDPRLSFEPIVRGLADK